MVLNLSIEAKGKNIGPVGNHCCNKYTLDAGSLYSRVLIFFTTDNTTFLKRDNECREEAEDRYNINKNCRQYLSKLRANIFCATVKSMIYTFEAETAAPIQLTRPNKAKRIGASPQ